MWRLLLTNNSLVGVMKGVGIERQVISESVVDVVLQFYCELQNQEWYLEEHKDDLDRVYGVLYWYIMNNIEYYNDVSEDKFKLILSNPTRQKLDTFG